MPKSSQNLFTNANDSTTDGLAIGVSETIYGDGKPYIITLDNAGAAVCRMQRRKSPTPSDPNPQWVDSGGGVNISVQRIGLAVQGFEYRVNQTVAANVNKTKFSVDRLRFSQGTISHKDLVQSLGGNQLFAFTEQITVASSGGDSGGDSGGAGGLGVAPSGPFTGLLTTTATHYVVDDPDPQIQEWFGGTWERVGNDMRYLVVWNQGMLLSEVLAGNYPGNPYNGGGSTGTGGGTGDGGGGNTGGDGGGDGGGTSDNTFADIGQPPNTYSGGATLDPPRNSRFEPVSATAANIRWGYPFTHQPDYLYEIVVNDIVRQRSLSGYLYVDDLNANVPNTVTYRTVRPDGSYSAAITVTVTPGQTGGTGGTGSDPGAGTGSNGTVTSGYFNRLDMGQFTYADGGTGASAQTISKNTDQAAVGASGTGYLQVNNNETDPTLQARAYYSNIADRPNNQIIWCRCWAQNLGDKITVRSNQSAPSEIQPTQGQVWQWLKVPIDADAYDRQIQIYGANDKFRIDTIVLVDFDNTDVPSGIDGFRSGAS